VYLSNGTTPPLGMVKRGVIKKGKNRKKMMKDEIKWEVERWHKCTRAKNKGAERVCERSILREREKYYFFWGGGKGR
jgi:hypothetical protein